MEKNRYHSFVNKVNLSIFFLGILVIIGWIFNITVLKSVLPQFNSMKFNAAVCFSLLGGCFFLKLNYHSKSIDYLCGLMALIVFACGILTLSEEVFNDLGIDTLLFADSESIVLKTGSPGRMSPLSAICFCFISISFFLLNSGKKKKKLVAQVLLHLVTLISFVALTGYLYNVSSFYRIKAYSSISIHATLFFLFISIANSLINPSIAIAGLFTGTRLGNVMARQLFTRMLILIIALGFFRILSHRFGLVNVEFGIALLTVSFAVLSLFLIWKVAADINTLDSAKSKAEYDIVKVKELKAQLRKLNEQFLSFFNLNPVSTSISSMKDSRFVYVNDAFLKIFSLKREDVIGKTSLEINIIDAEERTRVRQYMDRQSILKDYELVLKDSHGNRKHMICSNEVVELENEQFFLSTMLDISTRKKEEEELKSLSEFQNIILNGTEYSIIATDLNGIISNFNKGAEKMLGYRAEEMIGILSPGVFHDASEVVARAKILSEELNMTVEPGFDVFIIKPKLGYGVDINEWTYIQKNGSRITVELSVTALRDRKDDIKGYLGIAKDITDSKKAKEEIIKAKESAEQANLLKEAFLANMSHEIRTPMNAIIGFTDLLLSRKLDPIEQDYVKTIKHSGENLVHIINDILDVSKIDSGMMTFEEEPISIDQIFASLNAMLMQKVNEKNISLTFQTDLNMPETLLGDPIRLTQILLNLIGNAIKFTSKGGVEVFAKLLERKKEHCLVKFSVKDSGIGIPKEKQQFIFERFSQAESSTTRNYGGSGLGLSICKRLVELQGGNIHLESKEGIGSTFIFTLLLKETTLSYVTKGSKNKSEFENDKVIQLLSKVNILLVEDNPINVKLVMSLFSNYNFKADVAENGQTALNKAKNKKYDLILMDIEMPQMNGYEVMNILRKEEKSTVPIIVMTAHAMSGEREKCLRMGANEYISKPIQASILIEKMRSVLKL
jgi:PAS domain S-box-containing protein